MNKQAIRKAFVVCTFIGLMYAGIAFNVQDRFSMKRTYEPASAKTPRSLSVAAPQPAAAPVPQKKAVIANNNTDIEPSFLIAVPIVAFAIREGFIEKDGMIVVQKNDDDASSVYLKKPVDILKDKDKDGLKAICRIVGKKNIEVFLNRQGMKLPDKSLSVDTITGIGYSIDKNLLVNMYNTYVGEGFAPLMPYASGGFEVSRKNNGFQINAVRNEKTLQNAEGSAAFFMPDLSGLSMKAALDRISSKAQVKIYGSGIVVDQFPKPKEKVEKETRCALYGRSYQR
ncbi:MAG: hypothetical protein H6Q52_640 [Deltaproteobacteria bacterium]|nr:hypothetical protein [Deltaproteobacteria bacterium]